MEGILFIGLQASGKSSFYRERYFATHVRISLDLLRTRHRERRLTTACLETGQPLVIDNTNPTRDDRASYIGALKEASYTVVGYYFSSKITECLVRNQQRERSIPEVGLLATAKRLELPTQDEGFDALWYVRLNERGFEVEEWNDEI